MEKLSVYLCFVCFTSFAVAQSWKQLDSLAYVYTDTHPDSAIVLSQKAISLCEKEKNPVEYASCLSTMAYAQYKAKKNLKV